MLLGLGWNLGFIGATTDGDRSVTGRKSATSVQSFNDFLIFGSMAVGSFSSGQMLAYLSWSAINGVVFPVRCSAPARC